MKISIITTVYNNENYIEETLESVLAQRGDYILEYIVIDAMSTDSTFDKIMKYKNLVDTGFFSGRTLGIEMKVLREKDSGMYDGISKGFKLATGDVVAYINSDDIYVGNCFSSVLEVFEKFPQVKWLTGYPSLCDFKGQITQISDVYNYHRPFIIKGLYGTKLPFIQQESCFWRRELLNDLNFDKFKSFKLAGDFYLWYTFAQKTDLWTLATVLSTFRVVVGQKSEDIDEYKNEMSMITGNTKLEFKEKLYYKLLKQPYFNRSFNISDKMIIYDNISKNWQLLSYKKLDIRRFVKIIFLYFANVIVNRNDEGKIK